MPAKPRWLLAIPDAIRQLEKLDQDLLTRRDRERLFGVSTVRAAALMTAFGAGRTGHILTLPRAELLRQLRSRRKRAACRGEQTRRERVVTEVRKARLTGTRVAVPVEALEARVQAGATSLEMRSGGKGLLLPGVSGVRRGRVTIIGAGVVGLNACVVGVGFGADVTIIDINPLRLAYVRDVVQGHVTTLMSNAANIEGAVASADLVLCSVLIPGARTPRLVTRAHLAQMEPGSALVDVAVDQGGCAETSRPTTHHDPRYVEEGVVHYCVSNMPGAVPHTSTYALTNATMAYALEIADSGWRAAAERNPALAKGVNVVDGQVTHAAVAAAHGLDHVPLGET